MYNDKQHEHAMMERFESLELPIARLVDIRLCTEGSCVYKFSSVPWSIPSGEAQVKIMKR